MRIALVNQTRVSRRRLEEYGLGGSDSSAIYLLEALAANHSCFVFTPGEPKYEANGVNYAAKEEFPWDTHFDVLILFRNVNPLYLERSRTRLKIYWPTDVPSSTFGPIAWDLLDGVLCISSFQQEILFAFYPDLEKRMTFVLPHGVRAQEYFNEGHASCQIVKNPSRMIYCSSPNRGLEHLVRLLPRIQQRVANAELVVTFDYTLRGMPAGMSRYQQMFADVHGTRFVGNIPRGELVALQKSSVIMAYPCTYAEGFCVSALECMAAGAVPITTSYGALKTTVGDEGILIPGSPGQTGYDEEFVAAACSLLGNNERRKALSRKGQQRVAEQYTWDKVADRFISFVMEGLSAG